jgi:Flp pilus assembly protein TadD
MVTRFTFALLAAGIVPAAASAAPPPNEVGYPAGSLGVQQIAVGEYSAAERILSPVSREDATDPARLINIGLVYARTGRLAEAKDAFDAARNAPDTPLMLSNDKEISSRTLAAHLLKSLDSRFAAR